jgi:hypothetical protein
MSPLLVPVIFKSTWYAPAEGGVALVVNVIDCPARIVPDPALCHVPSHENFAWTALSCVVSTPVFATVTVNVVACVATGFDGVTAIVLCPHQWFACAGIAVAAKINSSPKGIKIRFDPTIMSLRFSTTPRLL